MPGMEFGFVANAEHFMRLIKRKRGSILEK